MILFSSPIGQIKTLMLILPSLKKYFHVKTKKTMGEEKKINQLKAATDLCIRDWGQLPLLLFRLYLLDL